MTLGRGHLSHLDSWLSSWELGVALESDGGVPWVLAGSYSGNKVQVGAIEAELNWKTIGGKGWEHLKRPGRLAGSDGPDNPR